MQHKTTIKFKLLINKYLHSQHIKRKKIKRACYESRANKYYSLRIALHKIIRKRRSINKVKIIKMA